MDTVNIQVLIHTEDGISRGRAEGVGLVWIDSRGELDEKLRRDMGWDGIGELVGWPTAVCQVGSIADRRREERQNGEHGPDAVFRHSSEALPGDEM